MAVAVDAGGCRDQWEGGGSLWETVVADGVGGYYCFGERERAMFGQKTFTRRLNGTSHVKDSCVDGSLCELVKGLISDG